MKKKEWLVKNGHLDASAAGRGRLSREHIALIEAAVAAGEHIEGYTVSKPTSSTDKPAEVVAVKPTSGTTIADIGEPTFPEAQWRAYVGGNEIGMRTVCVNCNCSLTYCRDGSPRVIGYGVDTDTLSVVTFKPRNDPNWRPRWW